MWEPRAEPNPNTVHLSLDGLSGLPILETRATYGQNISKT
jgi:hypothetical protein